VCDRERERRCVFIRCVARIMPCICVCVRVRETRSENVCSCVRVRLRVSVCVCVIEGERRCVFVCSDEIVCVCVVCV